MQMSDKLLALLVSVKNAIYVCVIWLVKERNLMRYKLSISD